MGNSLVDASDPPIGVLHYQMVFASVSGDSNQPNTILTLSPVRNDRPWSIANNIFTYAGAPDKIDFSINLYMDQIQSSGEQRIAPQLELMKVGNPIPLSKSATGYQRHLSQNHNNSSNMITFQDPNPGLNPMYFIRAQQGSFQTEVVQVDIGHFAAKSWTK